MKLTTAAVTRLLIAASLSLLPLAAPLAQPAADASKPIPPVQPQPTTVPGRPDVLYPLTDDDFRDLAHFLSHQRQAF